MKFSDVEVGVRFRVIDEYTGEVSATVYVKIQEQENGTNCLNCNYDVSMIFDYEDVELIEESEKKTYFAIRDQYGNFIEMCSDEIDDIRLCKKLYLFETRLETEKVLDRNEEFTKDMFIIVVDASFRV